MFRFKWISIASFTILAGFGFSQTPSGDPNNREELINQLLAMSPQSRRSYLKGMEYTQRKGLWFQVIREKAARKGLTPEQGFYRRPGKTLQHTAKGLKAKEHKRAVGTITYDTNVATMSFGGGALVGNRFDTHTGIPVLASGTVNTIQAVVVPGPAVTTNSAGFVMYGPLTTMGGALALFSTFTPGATGTVDTVTFTGLGVPFTGNTFLVLFGDFAQSYVPAVGTATTMGQGRHALVGYTGGMGPNITGTFNFGSAFNALLRATGDIVPVELMKFEVK